VGGQKIIIPLSASSAVADDSTASDSATHLTEDDRSSEEIRMSSATLPFATMHRPNAIASGRAG
jgi:hypothetical protein